MISREFSGPFPSSKHGIWVYDICVIFALDKCKNSSHIAALRAAARDQHIRSRAALARFSLYGAYERIFWIYCMGLIKIMSDMRLWLSVGPCILRLTATKSKKSYFTSFTVMKLELWSNCPSGTSGIAGRAQFAIILSLQILIY